MAHLQAMVDEFGGGALFKDDSIAFSDQKLLERFQGFDHAGAFEPANQPDIAKLLH